MGVPPLKHATTAAARLVDVNVDFPSPTGIVEALHKVSMEFGARTSTAIVGRSGSGKSTLVSLLALMRRPSSGQIFVGDVDTAGLASKELARLRSTEVGIVFQSFHLEPSLTVLENVMLQWYFGSRRTSQRVAKLRANELLMALGIEGLAGRRPQAMSGGQRQRVAIARALFPGPRLLVADEPTGNLDEETALLVAGLLMGLTNSLGATVVVVTHDAEVARLADQTLLLQRGCILDSPAEGPQQ